MKKYFAAFVAFFGFCGLAFAQFPAWQGTSTGYGQAQQAQQTVRATVVGVRDVQLAQRSGMFGSPQQGIGTAVGGLIGGAVGQKASGDYKVAALGALIGSAVGGAMTSAPQTVPAQEIILVVDGRQGTVAVTQSLADGVYFQQGQRVLLIGGTRVAPSSF